MTEALVVIAILIAAGGTLSLTNATLGVGIISLGILCAIFARIAQASSHHADIKRAIASGQETVARREGKE